MYINMYICIHGACLSHRSDLKCKEPHDIELSYSVDLIC